MPDTRPDPQLQRIFNLGHALENVVIRDLRKAGIAVLEKDPTTGRQYEYHAFGGHIAGHADGLIEELSDDGDVDSCILEIKSMNDSKFKECEKKGVRYSHPIYFAQVQFMMGLSGSKKSIFVAYNKNTSRYLSQVIGFDEFAYSAIEARVEKILENEAVKCATDESDWRCKGCFKRDVCWLKIDPPVECKTCAASVATADGGWRCQGTGVKCDDPCENWKRYEPVPHG